VYSTQVRQSRVERSTCSPYHPLALSTRVRGREILGSSVILGAFPTMCVSALVGSVGKGEQTYAIR
jgi:hypothetical protein